MEATLLWLTAVHLGSGILCGGQSEPHPLLYLLNWNFGQHLLRGEGGTHYKDLCPLIRSLPSYDSRNDTFTGNIREEVEPTRQETQSPRSPSMLTHNTLVWGDRMPNPSRNPTNASARIEEVQDRAEDGIITGKPLTEEPKKLESSSSSLSDALPTFNPDHASPRVSGGFSSVWSLLSGNANSPSQGAKMPLLRRCSSFFRRVRPRPINSNIPIQITLHLTTYFSWLMSQELLTPASATTMINAINSLQDTVVHLERVVSTPIPFAYQIHLRLSVW